MWEELKVFSLLFITLFDVQTAAPQVAGGATDARHYRSVCKHLWKEQQLVVVVVVVVVCHTASTLYHESKYFSRIFRLCNWQLFHKYTLRPPSSNSTSRELLPTTSAHRRSSTYSSHVTSSSPKLLRNNKQLEFVCSSGRRVCFYGLQFESDGL